METKTEYPLTEKFWFC